VWYVLARTTVESILSFVRYRCGSGISYWTIKLLDEKKRRKRKTKKKKEKENRRKHLKESKRKPQLKNTFSSTCFAFRNNFVTSSVFSFFLNRLKGRLELN